MLAATDWKCNSNSSEQNLKSPLKRDSGQADTGCSWIFVAHAHLRLLSPLLCWPATHLSTDREMPAACSLRTREMSRGRVTQRGGKEQPSPPGFKIKMLMVYSNDPSCFGFQALVPVWTAMFNSEPFALVNLSPFQLSFSSSCPVSIQSPTSN